MKNRIPTQKIFFLKTNYNEPYAFVYIDQKHYNKEVVATLLTGSSAGNALKGVIKLDKYIYDFNLRTNNQNFEDYALKFNNFTMISCYRRDVLNYRKYLNIDVLNKELKRRKKEFSKEFKAEVKSKYKQLLIESKLLKTEINKIEALDNIKKDIVERRINNNKDYAKTIHSIMDRVYNRENKEINEK